MKPIERPLAGPAPLLLLLVLGWLGGGADAARAQTTRCVDTTQELLAALEDAEFDEMRINVERGSYLLDADYSTPLVAHGITLIGGWDAGCDERLPDPRLTTISGDGNLLLSSSDFLRVESLAFVDTGSLELRASSRGRRTLTLRRVWLENLRCVGVFCTTEEDLRPVRLHGDYVHLDHVVATRHPSGCVVTIQDLHLREAGVVHSLFTENAGRALCVERLDDAVGQFGQFDFVVDNSVFWNNGLDLYTRYSSLITLRHNIYERLEMLPETTIAPVQTLDADPQFHDAAGRDFRLLASSPAIDSGRFSLQLAQEYDLVGNPRLIGDAPDRGPFETDVAESPLVVSNTLDEASPAATGSLRWAIEQANARPGLDHIRFALPGCPRVIELDAPLPDITDSVFVDGYSQSGSARNTSARGFTATVCVGVRDASLALDHALRIPAGAPDDTLLWVSGLAFGGFDVAAVRIAAGSGTWVFGNRFGGSLGGVALGNNAVNVRLGGTSHDNLIGGTEVAQRNLIVSAYGAGVELLDNSAGDEGYGNVVRNNFIGLHADGQDAAPNAIGVRVRSHRNRIEDNYIGGNQGDGVLIEGELAFDNEIRDNAIGLKTFDFCVPPCTPDHALGNGGAGVRLDGGGDDNAIRHNRIRHNGGAGVRLEDGLRNLVHGNSISANGALGIDLGTAGANPVYNSGLAVTGTYANRGVNAPQLTAADGPGRGGRVAGAIVGRNGVHLVDVFRNAECDASGRGEGLQALTAGAVTIDDAPPGGNGGSDFDFALPPGAALDGSTLTAVVTDADGNTSEFSSCLAYTTIACREILRDGFEADPPLPACTPP